MKKKSSLFRGNVTFPVKSEEDFNGGGSFCIWDWQKCSNAMEGGFFLS